MYPLPNYDKGNLGSEFREPCSRICSGIYPNEYIQQAVGYKVGFSSEWGSDLGRIIHLRAGILMVFEAINLVEIIQGKSIDEEDNKFKG